MTYQCQHFYTSTPANLSIVFPGIEMEIADVHMWDTPLEGNSLSLTLIYIIHEII